MEKLNYAGKRKHREVTFQGYVSRLDRRLVLPWFGSLGLQFFDYTLYTIYASSDRQVEVALKLQEMFQADFVNIFDDGIIISETLGMPLLKPDYDFPSVAEHRIKTSADLALLSVPDPCRDGRMPVNLEAVKRLAEASPKPVAINVEGPFTLAGQLMGVPDVARNIIKNRELIDDLIAFTTEAVGRYARALVKAGADLVSLAEPTAIILSPKQFEGLVLPALNRIYKTLDCWKALHICGDTNHLLEILLRTGVDGLSLDQIMNLPDLSPRIPDHIVVFGNIDPLDVMLEADPVEVADKTRQLLVAMQARPHFIMSTGCDLVVDTPRENMVAFMEAGRTSLKELSELSLSAYDREKHIPVTAPTSESLPFAIQSRESKEKPSSEALLEEICRAVENYDTEACLAACRRAIETGLDIGLIIESGLAKGMIRAGQLFEEQIYFVPELLMASESLHAGLDLLAPHRDARAHCARGRIVLGVVEGDIHEIGKNLVATMFQASGWEVIDLGTNVTVNDFLAATREHTPHIVGLSALMSTTMRAMPSIIETLKGQFPDVACLIGGAPLGPQHVALYNADGYGRDAMHAVTVAESLMQRSI
jgi:MtaA/CmuA family methyltransferase